MSSSGSRASRQRLGYACRGPGCARTLLIWHVEATATAQHAGAAGLQQATCAGCAICCTHTDLHACQHQHPAAALTKEVAGHAAVAAEGHPTAATAGRAGLLGVAQRAHHLYHRAAVQNMPLGRVLQQQHTEQERTWVYRVCMGYARQHTTGERGLGWGVDTMMMMMMMMMPPMALPFG